MRRHVLYVQNILQQLFYQIIQRKLYKYVNKGVECFALQVVPPGRRQIKRLKLGKGSAGILMDADGARAFVACSADNYIAVIDLKTLEVTSHLDVGGVPDGLAWSVQQ